MYRKAIFARSWMVLLGIDVDGMLRFSDDERRRRSLGTHHEGFSEDMITCLAIEEVELARRFVCISSSSPIKESLEDIKR